MSFLPGYSIMDRMRFKGVSACCILEQLEELRRGGNSVLGPSGLLLFSRGGKHTV